MPNIQDFWILSKEGMPLYFLERENDSLNQILMAGFFSALQILTENLEKSHLNRIQLENKTYFYYVHYPIISVIKADPVDEVESQVFQIIAQKLGQAFLDTYAKKLDTNIVDISTFQDFTIIYKKITSEIEQTMKKGHREFLSKYFIEAAKNKDILGVVVYDLEKDEVISSDIPRDCSVKDFESFGSMLFAFLERLGKELKTGKINEILIRAQKYWIGGFRKGPLAVFMLFDLEFFGKVLPEFVSSPLENI